MHRSRVSGDGPSLVLVSDFSNGSDPRLNLQFKLWLRLASTDKVAFTKLLLVSGLSPAFLSAFDEPTLNGIIENFIASTDWRPIEQTIKADLNVDVREYAARIKAPTLLVTAKHDQIVPPAYSENLVADAKTVELNSGHLIFRETSRTGFRHTFVLSIASGAVARNHTSRTASENLWGPTTCAECKQQGPRANRRFVHSRRLCPVSSRCFFRYCMKGVPPVPTACGFFESVCAWWKMYLAAYSRCSERNFSTPSAQAL